MKIKQTTAIELFKFSNGTKATQLAKRMNDKWFYRNYVNKGYAKLWDDWKEIEQSPEYKNNDIVMFRNMEFNRVQLDERINLR